MICHSLKTPASLWGLAGDVKVALEGLNGEKNRGLKAAVKYVKEHDMGMTEDQIQEVMHM